MIIRHELVVANIKNQIGVGKAFITSATPYETDRTAGDSLKIITDIYSGPATRVAENTKIEIEAFNQETRTADVFTLAKGYYTTYQEVTESETGEITAKVLNHLLTAINDGFETELYNLVKTGVPTAYVHEATETKLNLDVIIDAMVKFGGDLSSAKDMIVSSVGEGQLAKDPTFVTKSQNEIAMIGTIHNTSVKVSPLVQPNEAYILRKGALAYHLNKNVIVSEVNKPDYNRYEHYASLFLACYIADLKGIVKIVLASE